MKRLMILLAVLLALCVSACADQLAEEDALQVMLDAHPGYSILTCDQWSPTAAAVLGKGEERILCVAEKKNNEWVLTVDNAKALPKGAEVSILMDTDTSLFWSIREENQWLQYSCFRQNGVWGQVTCIRQSIHGENGLIETSYPWEDNMMRELVEYYDANENFIRREEGPWIPAQWLGEYLTLDKYDAEIVPVPDGGDANDGWLNRDALRRCAEEIAPGYAFVSGEATNDGLELLAEKDGALRLITCVCINGEKITNISSVLPEGTHYGWENFGDCVTINQRVAAAVRPYANGVWGVDYTWPMGEGEELFFGRNWVSDSNMPGRGVFYVGDNPWSDVSAVRWDTLPATMEEALEHIDPGRWAAVNNPNPADRLHLREKADRGSRSFGKYYNGTPVEVLQKGETWTRVRIQGRTGWMMTRYLAFGKDAWKVKNAFPDLFFAEHGTCFPVWQEIDDQAGQISAGGDWTAEESENFCIIGLLGDEWYHVWFTDLDVGGYMRQSDFWPGNG